MDRKQLGKRSTSKSGVMRKGESYWTGSWSHFLRNEIQHPLHYLQNRLEDQLVQQRTQGMIHLEVLQSLSGRKSIFEGRMPRAEVCDRQHKGAVSEATSDGGRAPSA